MRRFSEFREHAEFRAMAGTGRCIEFREHAMLVVRWLRSARARREKVKSVQRAF